MRTFGLTLLAFVTGVGLLVAALSWQGRAAREYAGEAVRAAVKMGAVAQISCEAVLGREPPATVQECVVDGARGARPARALLTLEGGRVSVVRP
ncbi:hypothetical protein QOL99_09190 [Deinococcus sp. MIMF12]|uniref:Flp pilus-assembly TadG-like N-terminal domain-containing protein n=1 Tax=Deinococcus rhizophilus TaxID=3049544 RepID=A0ABT7JGZ5_9DEIO|nr:hypothetical protein [Deinococcus rhizophilus]MDL2344326.1 hypothetical protein [Deinococcus rhizophilus]